LFDEANDSSFGMDINAAATWVKNLHLTLLQLADEPSA